MALDRRALEDAFARLETPLYNFVLRWTWNPALAQELTQEAFARVWRARASVDASTLKGALYKTAQNLAIDERRRAQRAPALPLAWLGWAGGGAQDAGPEREFVARERLERVRAALESLPLDLRETFLMARFSDMSHEEIGRALGVAPGTVASRVNRAAALIAEGERDG